MGKNILFTGGHHNSALVVAISLKKLGHQVVWIGHKFTIRGDKVLSAEYQEVTAQGIPFTELKTGKFYKKKNPFEFLKIFFGFVQAFLYLLHTKPDLIISFGGYLAVPIVIAGWVLGVPSVTHEQTVTAGWANKAISPFVKKIFVTHASSIDNYPKDKTVVTGLPIRPELILKIKYKKPKLPLIYVTCGKQGSQVINKALFPIISELVKRYQVVHQTGAHTINQDQDKARRTEKALLKEYKSRYIHQPYFFSDQATKYLRQASLVVSRSGAHITYELILLNKKNVVIPIPWVSHNEQFQNAQLLQKQTTSTILSEEQLTPDTLLLAIRQTLKRKLKFHKKASVYTDATLRIIKELQPYL